MRRLITLTFILCAMIGCRQQHYPPIPDEIEEISFIADTNGQEALRKLAPMMRRYVNADRAVVMRLELLRVKAQDKADIPLKDDTLMRQIVDYYDAHGTPQQRLEAYYYLGGTFRDLHDSPQALKAYLKAAEWGEEHINEVDSMLLYYVYSQLSQVYELQDNDPDAIEAYKKALRLKTADAWDYTILGQEFDHIGASDSARFYYRKAMLLLMESPIGRRECGHIGSILSFFLKDRNPTMAQLCMGCLDRFSIQDLPANACCAKGQYFQATGQTDSAEMYYRHAYDHLTLSNARRDCALRLYEMYSDQQAYEKKAEWADRYIVQSQLANEELAQARVANIGNEYQYRRDLKEEAKLKEQALMSEKRLWMLVAVVLIVILAAIAAAYVFKRRYDFMFTQHLALKHDVERERRRRARLSLDISDVREKFRTMEDNVDEESWEILFASVDKAYPGFGERIDEVYPELKSSYRRILYLYKVGLKKIEIARAMKVNRSDISRKIQKLESLYPLKEL